MLFTKLPDNTVRGVLIDFDCAKDITDSDFSTRPERTGTYPYMSINNLANSDVKRTQLDDWESLIYVLCWLGTTGINLNDEKQFYPNDQLPISDWQGSDPKRVARAKRHHLQTWSGFVGDILNGFLKLPGYSQLKRLVGNLYTHLFSNRKYPAALHGTIARDESQFDEEWFSEGDDSGSEIEAQQTASNKDPFEQRAKCAADIANDLLEVILTARTKALERLRSQRQDK
ncbi:hypothetical protein H4S06_003989 [Coemansia sp. BCRC 34490]|nr:hypothetical protein H4S06_003989 [Coemansia sp. BCRC 34490]